MKHQLHRSITFWSGLLVMGFVCWAWRDSLGHDSYASWKDLSFANSESRFYISQIPGQSSPFVAGREGAERHDLGFHSLPLPFVARGQGAVAPPYPDDSATFEEWTKRGWNTLPVGSWQLCIPTWLILLAVAIPWTALMLWRVRRRKRAVLTAP